jgi:dihydrofolate reductase
MKIYSNLSLIAAVGRNKEIGCKNRLLCHLPNDLQYFKKITLHSTVVMGENTYHSLPVKPLPKRRNIVLSANSSAVFLHCRTAHSIEEVLDMIKLDRQVFIIGGASVYHQFLPFATKLYITQIDADFPEADVFFPFIDPNIWVLTETAAHSADEKHQYNYDFRVLERKNEIRLE